MKNYQKTFKTIMTGGIFLTSLLISNLVLAQASGGGPTGAGDPAGEPTGEPITDHRLYQSYYADPVLQGAGCAKPVWDEMNRVFITTRTLAGEMEKAVMVTEQMAKSPRTSPPGGKGSCYDQALNNINSAAGKIKALLTIISGLGGMDFGSGSFDFGALSDNLMGQLTRALDGRACSEINNLVGRITSSGSRIGGINGAIGGAVGGVIGNPGNLIGTGINGINVPLPRLPTANNPTSPFAP